jgi:hypothetical protein
MVINKFDNSRNFNERVREVMVLDSSPVPERFRSKIEYQIRVQAVTSGSRSSC